MSLIFFHKFYKNYKKKKKYYNKNIIIIWNLILGQLTKKGKKNISYYFLIEVLYLLKKIKNKRKKNKKILPFEELTFSLHQLKPSILLYTRKRGTITLQLPRFLTIKQSNKKSIEWWIKLSKKRKKKNLKMLLIGLKNAKFKEGNIIKKKREIKLNAEKNRPFFYLLR